VVIILGLFLMSLVQAQAQGLTSDESTPEFPVNRKLPFFTWGFQLGSTLPFYRINENASENANQYTYGRRAHLTFKIPELNFNTSFGSFAWTPVARYKLAGKAFFTSKHWSVGTQARYKFNYNANQLLIPSAGVGVESLGPGNYERPRAWVYGPVLGLDLNLNSLSPEQGGFFYERAGIRRTYINVDAFIPLNDTPKREEWAWSLNLHFMF